MIFQKYRSLFIFYSLPTIRNREKAGGWLKQPVFYTCMYFSHEKRPAEADPFTVISINRLVRLRLTLDQAIDYEVHHHNEGKEYTCPHVGVH